MRLGLLAAAALLAGYALVAAGTSPSLPIEARAELDGKPGVGDVVTLRVHLELHGNPDFVARLHGSPTIEWLDDPVIHVPADGVDMTVPRRFRVTADGPWSLALSRPGDADDWYGIGGPCCGYGWSMGNRGDFTGISPYGHDGFRLPDPEGRGEVAAQADGTVVRVTYMASGAPWLSQWEATLEPSFGPGYISVPSNNRAISADHQQWQIAIDIPDGGDVVAYATSQYQIQFPRPVGLPEPGSGFHTFRDESKSGELHCQNLRIARDGDQARVEDTWPCTERANALRGLPALPPLTGPLLIGGLAVALRRKAQR